VVIRRNSSSSTGVTSSASGWKVTRPKASRVANLICSVIALDFDRAPEVRQWPFPAKDYLSS
jgi:hypothetical protein